MRLTALFVLTCALISSCVAEARATMTILLEMTGDAVAGTGDPDGFATGPMTFDPFLGAITWTLDYTDVSGQQISLLVIHGPGAMPGQGASSFLGLPLSTTVTPNGTLTGSVQNVGSEVDTILADPTGFYLDLHTDDPGGFPGGALRFDFFQPIVADGSGNGEVGPEDYTIWADGFGQTGVGRIGDYSSSGQTGPEDYTLWADNFGNTSAGASALSVPEPSSFALAVLALALTLGSCVGRRRRYLVSRQF